MDNEWEMNDSRTVFLDNELKKNFSYPIGYTVSYGWILDWEQTVLEDG